MFKEHRKATSHTFESKLRVMSLSFDASSWLPVLTHQLVLFLKKKKRCLFFGGRGSQFHLCFSLTGLTKAERESCLVSRRQISDSDHKMLTLLQEWKTPPLFYQEFRNLKVKGQKVRVSSRESVALVMFWSLVFFFFLFSFFCSVKRHDAPERT